ncbi:MAG: TIGR01212 family radical SAM protein [Spirochaetia bacterium]
MKSAPFLSYSEYLRNKYGKKVYRVSVDAGFGCPNRENGREGFGCTYCDEAGSRAPYLGKENSLENQIEKGIGFIRNRYGAEEFVLYFQAFSGTYGDPEKLKKLYDTALSIYPFKEFIVSTRPDCVDREITELLASYKSHELDVWVELGLQSANNDILAHIRRGHTVEDFKNAYELISGAGLKRTVHLMFGLPGEKFLDIEKTCSFSADLIPDGLKIHNCTITAGTPLSVEYTMGEYSVFHYTRFAEHVISCLRKMPSSTVIMRLTFDTAPEKRVAPKFFLDKNKFYSYIIEEMNRRGISQGDLRGI